MRCHNGLQMKSSRGGCQANVHALVRPSPPDHEFQIEAAKAESFLLSACFQRKIAREPCLN